MTCCTCKKDQPLTEFRWKNKTKGIRHHQCKTCLKRFQDSWYQRNKKRHIANVSQRRREGKAKIRGYILEYLKSHPCSNCGETDPIVLEFHHRNGEEKRANIGEIYGVGFSWKIVEKEIAKCDVLCANCHHRKTAKEQGWYKSVLSDE